MIHAIGFGMPMFAVLIAGFVLAIVFGRKRYQAPPVVYVRPRQVIYPPVYQNNRRSNGSGGRRFLWRAVVVLIVVAAGLKALAPSMSRTATYVRHGPVNHFEKAVEVKADVTRVQNRVQVAAPQMPTPPQPSKPRPWWMGKNPPPPSTGTGPAWAGTVERSCIATLADSRDEMLNAVRMGIERQLNLRQAPSPMFVGNSAWVQINEKDRQPLKNQDDAVGDVVHINYSVELTQKGWTELAREERADLAGGRFETALRGLGVLTVLLGAVAAYIRLDEWTKGYYSGRLFLAAMGLVTLLGAGIVLPDW
jgi:hypothetical protein